MKQKITYRAFVFGFWILMSIAVIVLWVVSFASGKTWEAGLFAYQNGNIPVFHVVAECGMSVVVLAGVAGWLRRARWGHTVTVFGVGMFGYSAINSFGWALHNEPFLTLPMIVSLVGAVLLFPIAVRGNTGDDIPRP